MQDQVERERLRALARYDIMSTSPDQLYGRYAWFAAHVLNTPMAYVALIGEDRQWLRARVGVDLREIPRTDALCNVTIRGTEPVVVNDLMEDPRFRDNPHVQGPPHARFYAGVPLVTPEGYSIGTLCVLDTVPRHRVDPQAITALREVGIAVMANLELRRAATETAATSRELHDQQALLASIYDTVRLGIALTNPEGMLYQGNAHLASLLSVDRDALVGRNLVEFLDEDEGTRFLTRVRQAIEDEGEAIVDTRIVTETAGAMDVSIASRPLVTQTGEVLLLSAISDVTAERRQRRLAAARADVMAMIVANAPVAKVLDRICRLLENQVSESLVIIRRWHRGGLARAVAPSMTPYGRQRLSNVTPGGARSFSAEAAIRQQPMEAPDLDVLDEWTLTQDLMQRQGYRSIRAEPLLGQGGEPFGVITLVRRAAGTFTDGERELLSEAGRLAGLALTHADMLEDLRQRAYHDPLTGLGNRDLLDDRLQREMARVRRRGGAVGLILLDLDDFKLINDSLGHAAGDRVLIDVAERLRATTRDEDIICRLGGDEFVLMFQVEQPNDLLAIGRKVLDAASAPVHLGDRILRTTTSVGVAVYPRDADDAAGLLKAADSAMYAAKGTGKNALCYYDESMSKQALETLELAGELRQAVADAAFDVDYQARFDLTAGRVLGLEAFVRWPHPTRGRLEAGAFIAEAEAAGVLPSLDRQVLVQSLPRLATWRQKQPALRLFWNLCTKTLREPDFIDWLAGLMQDHDLPPTALEIEVLEREALQNASGIRDRLNELRHRLPGVRVGLDDFGLDHGAIAMLHRIPVDALKIDRHLVASMTTGPTEDRHMAESLTHALVIVANRFGLDVVVEGVESDMQRRCAVQMGCSVMQGNLFHAPEPAPEVLRLVTAQGLA